MSNNSDWNKKLQLKINEIVKIIDFGLPCLARGHFPATFHAGHVFARGGNQSMRFNLHNIHRQSAESNTTHKDDMLMREGLVKEYGQGYIDFVSELRCTDALKLFQYEYKEIYDKACIIEKLMRKKIHQPISPHFRIQLRNDVNSYLGIYPSELCIYPPLTH